MYIKKKEEIIFPNQNILISGYIPLKCFLVIYYCSRQHSP